MLNQEEAQTICDKWSSLLAIESWKFTIELKDSEDIQFRYNCTKHTVILEILYKEATEERIVSMLVDFSLIHQLLPRLKEEGEQYIDHDDRNIKHIVGALLKLDARQEGNNNG